MGAFSQSSEIDPVRDGAEPVPESLPPGGQLHGGAGVAGNIEDRFSWIEPGKSEQRTVPAIAAVDRPLIALYAALVGRRPGETLGAAKCRRGGFRLLQGNAGECVSVAQIDGNRRGILLIAQQPQDRIRSEHFELKFAPAAEQEVSLREYAAGSPIDRRQP